MTTTSLPISQIFGVPINAISMEQTLDCVHDAISNHRKLQIGVVNAAKIVNMEKQPFLKKDVLSSDLILADGAAVVWASRVLGKPLPERVAGIDLMYGILKRGSQCGYRVFCFGATEQVSELVEARIKENYPGIILAGRRNGYYSDAEEDAIAESIAKAEADVLFVAMTSPKKEKFLAKYSEKMCVSVCHGVGGSFDVMAGKVQRAPDAWQRLGLEWLFRLKQEPGRLWKRYLITNSIFCKMLIMELFKKSE